MDPNFPQIPQAQGNPSMSSLLEMIQRRETERPSLQQQQQALMQYTEAVRNAQPMDDGAWTAMGSGALTTGLDKGPGHMWAGAGAEIVKRRDATREDQRKRDVEAAKIEYADVVDRRKSADSLKYMRGATPSQNAFEPRRNADGTTTVFSKATGMPVGTYGPQDYGKINETANRLAKSAFDKGEFEALDEALKWAQQQALSQYVMVNQSLGNRTAPLGGQVGGVPEVGARPQAEGTSSTPQMAFPTANPDKTAMADEQANNLAIRLDAIRREKQRYGDNPMVLESLNKEETDIRRRLAGVGKASPVSAVPLPKKNLQLEEEKKKYGDKIGGHMADTSIDLQKTGAAANTLTGDLNVMETLYKQHGDDIPEGAGGDVLNNIKGTLKTLGVEVQGQKASDIIKALATKQALKSRTADGENLLPGAMSNYEDRLLQSMSPGLLMSQEGSMMMIQIIKAQMRMRVELAAAAREYVKNKGRLDEGWFDVAAKYAANNPFLDEARVRAMERYAASLQGEKK